jgi:S-ribosylhomocysteine lyase LuxS involved in autoinducer biosynthesis
MHKLEHLTNILKNHSAVWGMWVDILLSPFLFQTIFFLLTLNHIGFTILALAQ